MERNKRNLRKLVMLSITSSSLLLTRMTQTLEPGHPEKRRCRIIGSAARKHKTTIQAPILKPVARMYSLVAHLLVSHELFCVTRAKDCCGNTQSIPGSSSRLPPLDPRNKSLSQQTGNGQQALCPIRPIWDLQQSHTSQSHSYA